MSLLWRRLVPRGRGNARLTAVLVLALVAMACPSVSAATYYIDYNAPDDSAAGTSRSAPWKHHPYMQGFSGSYNPLPGDVYVFKGGVVWPSVCFSMAILTGGSTGNPDLYTTDPTWFVGASYSAPVWDGGYAPLAGAQSMVTINSLQDITFNGLEVRNFKAMAGFGQGMFSLYNCNTIHWTNDYLHGWSLDSSVATDDAHGAIVHIVAGGQGMQGMVVDSCTIENSAWTGIRQNGVAIRQVNTVSNSVLHDVSSLVLFAGDFHGNTVYNISYPAGNASFDPTYHTNVLYLSLWDGNAAIMTPATVYDNVFHDIGTGTPAIYFTPGEIAPFRQTLYAYNNLIYGANAVNLGVEIDPAGTVGTTGTAYVLNNTVVLPAPKGDFIHCVDRGGNPEVNNVIAQDNHVIGSEVTVLFGRYATATVDHNLVQTPALAQQQGYSAGNLYAPTSTAGSTVGQGVDESAVFTTDIRGVPRPQSDGWDIGAYQLAVAGLSGGPEPPTGLRVVQ